jgi:hypothetical protein
MTNTFKKSIYRWCIVSAASFLAAFLLYDLEDAGIATEQLVLPCAILLIAGVLLSFKALEVWSGWRDDTSEDLDVALTQSNPYPITFYSEATLAFLIVVFLLVFALIRNQPTIAEGTVSFVVLVVAGACTGMGLYSSHLR